MQLFERTCKYEQMNIERIFARAFVLFGGIFWIAAFFGASFSYQGKSLAASVGSAFIPLGIAVAAFLLGWFYEMLASVALFVGSVGVVVYGILMGWETGVWLTMGVFFIGPMIIAALLFLLAARMQRVCELQEVAPQG